MSESSGSRRDPKDDAGDEPEPDAQPKQIEKVKADNEKPIEKIKADNEKLFDKPLKHELEKQFKREKNEFKEGKNEFKEHKHEKLEKNEIKEHKGDKQEKVEKPEWKEQKDELKEFKDEIKELKPENKELIKEGGKSEFEKPPPGEGPIDPGDLVISPEQLAQHADALEATARQLRHFIEQSERPDLSRGALKNEPDESDGS
jgi:hypothetical protein